MLPETLGVDIEMRYPTVSDFARLGIQHAPDINMAVDSVLTTVYNVNKSSGASTQHRRIVFSSFNPVICTALNWKQPNCMPLHALHTIY